MKRAIWAGAVVAFTAIYFGLYPVPTGAAAPKPVVLKMVGWRPDNHPLGAMRAKFVKDLAARSNGEITINWIGGDEVMPPDDVPQAVSTGVVPIAHGTNTAYEKLVPQALTLDGCRLTSSQIRQSGYYDYLEKAHNKKNIHIVAIFRGLPFYFMFGKKLKAPEKIEDLSGSRVRFPGHYTLFAKRLGMVPVRMPPYEAISALDRGIIQGLMSSLPGPHATGTTQLLSSVVDIPVYIGNLNIIMNSDAWKDLTAQQQKWMTEVGVEVENWAVGYLEKMNVKTIEEVKALGVKLVKFTPPENEKFIKMAYDSFWEFILEKMPSEGAQLRKLAGE